MSFTIEEVTTARAMRRFLRFPLKLYRRYPMYVPPLLSGERQSLTASPSLEYCARKMWVARNERGRVIGRIVGVINPRYNELYHTKRVRFGWFEVIEDIEVARALIDTVAAWGRLQGMEQLHGPLGYNTWGRQGMMVEGFENLPQFNTLYNPPYYPQLMEQLGFIKEVDWIQYRMPAGQPVPEKLVRINERIMQRYNLRVFTWESPQELEPYLEDFFKTYNESFATVHNFIPLTPAEIQDSVKEYVGLLDPQLSTFVVDEHHHVVAFSVVTPSLSRAFKKARGRLFPFGWLHLRWGLKHFKDLDLMLSGVHPQWHNKGLSSIYHCRTHLLGQQMQLREAITNPQIEDNRAVEVWKAYNTSLHTRRRLYIKDI